jgi:hypothetical protein
MHYSLLGRDVERDVVPMMARYGLGMTVWSPLASGFLSGKYTRDSLTDPDNRWARRRTDGGGVGQVTSNEGGDEVCWLDRLCPECGALPSAGEPTCWRCGAPVPDRPGDAPRVE